MKTPYITQILYWGAWGALYWEPILPRWVYASRTDDVEGMDVPESNLLLLSLFERKCFGSVFKLKILSRMWKLKKKIRVRWEPQMVLRLPQGQEVCEYVLSFKIGQREGGFYSAHTDTGPSTVF